MNENQEAYLLAGVGLARGVYDQYLRPRNFEQRIDNIGAVVALGALAYLGYQIFRK